MRPIVNTVIILRSPSGGGMIAAPYTGPLRGARYSCDDFTLSCGVAPSPEAPRCTLRHRRCVASAQRRLDQIMAPSGEESRGEDRRPAHPYLPFGNPRSDAVAGTYPAVVAARGVH